MYSIRAQECFLAFRQGALNPSRKSSPGFAGRTIKSTLLLVTAAAALWFSPLNQHPLEAQITTADVLGTVTDRTGAVIPGATVTLLDLDTHEKRTATANQVGEFVFNLLKPNRYSLTVASKGFETFQIASFTLAGGDRAREDAHLSVGSEAQVVQVEAQEPALQTDSSVLTSIVTDKATQDLPLNGRNYINLVQVTPGATEGLNGGLASGSRPDDRRQTSSISINGQSDVNNDQMIDGMDNNERIIGSIGVRPSVDAIQEVRVQTNTFTAEVGRAAGAVVNVLTKSGSNSFHGSAYEFLRNTALNANAYNFGQTIPKPAWHQNQFGGSLGGPIRKDKTFFFGDYEGLRIVRGQNPSQTTVPTLFERQNVGNFTDNPSISNQIVPTSQIDQVGLQYFQLFPLPNGPGLVNNYTSAPSTSQYSTTFDGRIDHHFNDNNLFFGRYTYNAVSTFNPGLYPLVDVDGLSVSPGGNGQLYPGQAKDDAQQVQFNFVHTFSPTLILELKAGYTFLNNQQVPLNYGENVNQAFGQDNINLGAVNSGLAPIAFAATGGNLGQTTPIIYVENTFQYIGALTWTHGKHNVKIGGGLLRRQVTVSNIDDGKGNWTVSDFSTLLNGNYSLVDRNNILILPHYRTWEPHGYIQDDWHIASNLTLNLGARYDLYTPFTEVKNQLSNFDTSLARIVVAGTPGVSKYDDIAVDYSNFAPRVGFAYTARPGTVVRGGFGLTFAPENQTSGSGMVNQPFVSSFGPCTPALCAAAGGSAKLAGGVPVPVASSATNPQGSIIAAEQPDFKSSYIEQFNLTVEKEFRGSVVSASYVGELGRRLAYYLNDVNALPPNTAYLNPTYNYNQLRPFYAAAPGITTIPYWASKGRSSYNALQLVVQHRLRHGLDFAANYTLAHGLDDSETISNDGGNGFGSVPSQVATLDYGNSTLDVRNRFAVTTNYSLPFGANLHGVEGLLAKGWQLNGIYVYSTGMPFSVTNSTNVSGTEPGSSGSDRPNQVASTHIANPGVAEWFNVNAFAAQTPGIVGSEARNQIYGPRWEHLDLSVFKTFPITERINFEFRTEAFNVQNTANFAAPNAALGASGFGSITTTVNAYNPRVFQFAGKIQF
jgi:hypothetical protein